MWRLRRCAVVEERLGWRSEWFQQDRNRERHEDLPPGDPAINPHTMAAQASVDRAQAQNCMRRAKAELDKLQATRSPRTISQNEANSTASSSPTRRFYKSKPLCKTKANSPAQPKPIAPPRSRSSRNIPCPCGSGLTVALCRLVNRHAQPETEVRGPQPAETAFGIAA